MYIDKLRGLVDTLIELKYIVLIDFVLNNTDHYHQDVVGLEDEDSLKNLLQTCIEFVVFNDKTQFEMSYFNHKPEFNFSLKHSKSWALESNKEEGLQKTSLNYPCFRITAENPNKNSKLYCTIYSFEKANINWFSEFSKDILVEKISPTAIAVDHFREILEERELKPDTTNLKTITKIDNKNRKTLENTNLSITDFCYQLFFKLKEEPEGTSTCFKFNQYPLFETNYSDKSIFEYWLVSDKSARKQ